MALPLTTDHVKKRYRHRHPPSVRHNPETNLHLLHREEPSLILAISRHREEPLRPPTPPPPHHTSQPGPYTKSSSAQLINANTNYLTTLN